MSADIRCPIHDGQCFAKFKLTREHSPERIRKDLKHHLYMHHGISVIQSHEMARHVIAQLDKDVSKYG